MPKSGSSSSLGSREMAGAGDLCGLAGRPEMESGWAADRLCERQRQRRHGLFRGHLRRVRTGKVEFDGKSFQTEGGPARGDFHRLITEISEALQVTLADSKKFERSAERVLRYQHHIRIKALERLETILTTLWSPAWPEGMLPAIETAQGRTRQAGLRSQLCVLSPVDQSQRFRIGIVVTDCGSAVGRRNPQFL